ncbi:MAG: M16 family metallopeptidase, partial [Pyrinomonadaceae bacterium]
MKRSLLLLALIFSLLAPQTLVAGDASILQQRRRAASPQRPPAAPQSPTAAATAPARLPQAQLVNRILPNGLEIIVLEDHSIPLVTIELAVKNGSYTEPPELNGLSHLYEHMFFKANRAMANREDYLKTIGQLGVAYNASTREEVVNYYFTTTSPNLRTAMQFMKDSVRYPLYLEGEFEREREVVIGEIDRNESNPYYYLNKEMTERL